MRDYLAWRRLLGVITPSVNTCVQPEFDDMRPPGVTNHLARMFFDIHRVDSDADFQYSVERVLESIPAAVSQIATCKPDHLILGISALAVWGGSQAWSDELKQRMSTQAGGVGVTLATDALIKALHAYGIKRRIAIVEPYYPVIQPRMESFFAEHGFEVVKFNHMKSTVPSEYSHVSAKFMIDSLRNVDNPDAEAIVQFGANLAMARINDEAERWLEKPVIGVNAALYWHALRACGVDDKIHGFTRLLSEF